MKFFRKNKKCKRANIIKKGCLCLKDVKNNTDVTLENLCSNYRLKRKLQEMGLTEGVKLRVLNNTDNGPVVVNVRGSKLALGFGMSQKIVVKEIAK